MQLNVPSLKAAFTTALFTFLAVLTSSYVLYDRSVDALKGTIHDQLAGLAQAARALRPALRLVVPPAARPAPRPSTA